jgi:hypothetical protein
MRGSRSVCLRSPQYAHGFLQRVIIAGLKRLSRPAVFPGSDGLKLCGQPKERSLFAEWRSELSAAQSV